MSKFSFKNKRRIKKKISNAFEGNNVTLTVISGALSHQQIKDYYNLLPLLTGDIYEALDSSGTESYEILLSKYNIYEALFHFNNIKEYQYTLDIPSELTSEVNNILDTLWHKSKNHFFFLEPEPPTEYEHRYATIQTGKINDQIHRVKKKYAFLILSDLYKLSQMGIKNTVVQISDKNSINKLYLFIEDRTIYIFEDEKKCPDRAIQLLNTRKEKPELKIPNDEGIKMLEEVFDNKKEVIKMLHDFSSIAEKYIPY